MACSTRFNLIIFISLMAAVMLLGSIPTYGDDNTTPGTLNQKKNYTFPQSENSNLPAPVMVKPGERLPGTGMQSSSQKGPSALPGTARMKSIKSYSFPQPGGGAQQSSRNNTSSQTLPQVKLMAPYSFPRVNIPSDLNNDSTQQDPYTVRMQYYQTQTAAPYNNSSSTTYPWYQNNNANYPGSNSYWNRQQNSATPNTYYNNNQLYQNMVNILNNIYNNSGRSGQYMTNPYNNYNSNSIYQFFRNSNSSYPYNNSTNTNNNGNYYWRGQ
ncbi:MAG: hypothetical protein AB9903_16715 [Vulcanimicrobiota bacterium]